MGEKPTVVDLYCGGGGFSEGFRQAGFNVTCAVDWSNGAVKTYRLNIPDAQETKVLQRSLIKDINRDELPSDVPQDIKSLDEEELPDNPDVVIGSPPCTEFSRSKNGGKGDKKKGKGAVERFFELVAELDPDYWVMENVPNSQSHVKDAFQNVKILSLSGDIDDHSHVLTCSNYETPQSRRRLFFGQFPAPEKSESNPPSLGDVVQWSQGISEKNKDVMVDDPLYPISIPKSKVTDWCYEPYLTEREAEEIRLKKEDHSYYGRMSFPEDAEDYSRTVMATDRTLARETIVVEDEDRKPENGEWKWSPFRKPTIRELATIQGFPITYQFEGKNARAKWQRVGDAVPPTVAFNIAKAMRVEIEGIEEVATPRISDNIAPPEVNLNGSGARSRRQMRISRPFSHHVPYDNKREFRVDLATAKDNLPEHPLADACDAQVYHPVRFYVVLNKGYAKTHEEEAISLWRAKEMVGTLLERRENIAKNVRRFLVDINEEIGNKVPDATTLQATRTFRKDWTGEQWDDHREYEILEQIAAYPDEDRLGLVDRWFSYDEFGGETIEFEELIGGTELPIRVLMKIMAVSYVAHKLNHCSQWMKQNPERVYLPNEINRDDIDIHQDPCCKSIAPLDGCIKERFNRYSKQTGFIDLLKVDRRSQPSVDG